MSKTHGVRLMFLCHYNPDRSDHEVSGLFATHVVVRIKRVEFLCLNVCMPTGRDTEVQRLFLEYEKPRQ